MSNVFNTLLGGSLQNAALSIHLTLVFLLICIFAKPLNKIASMKYIIGLVSTSFFFTVTLNPGLGEMLDIRHLCRFIGVELPKPLLHLAIPVRIASKISEIPSTDTVDWLSICVIIWIIGICFVIIRQLVRKKAFRRIVDAPNARIPCPEHIQLKLQDLLSQDQRWITQHAAEETPTHIELCCIEAFSSPCTFDTDTKNPVIALDRMDYSDEELDLILRHELSHLTLKHGSALTWLRTFRAICWFNPALVFIERWTRQQIELIADDDVLLQKNATPEQRVSYARLLVDLAQEKQLHGIALHLSAGAKFVLRRTEEILRPRRRILSLPVSILLIVSVLFGTLLIAPGETLESRFSTRQELLACVGNDYDYVRRGLDPFRDEPRFQPVYIDSCPVYIEEAGGGTCYLYTFTYPEFSADEDFALQYRDAWLDEINALLGEPTVISDPFFSRWDTTEAETYIWPVTLTNADVDSQANLELYWKHTLYDENRSDYTITIQLQPADTKS